MCDSLYFSLLFRKLSDTHGNIGIETINKLSNFYTGQENVLNMYDTWKNNPQLWCLKSDTTVLPVVRVGLVDVTTKTNDVTPIVTKKADVTDIVMVIHVCDEPKNLKRDFQCPKELLINEMRYFADYLSTESQCTPDVDISVHCDVNIFDWLMKYVKRARLPANERVSVASMKPNNAISILISSDFLKMDSLVEECITYIRDNINTILSSSFNINCISPPLMARIADKFSNFDLENVVDKKDKIKSGLYRKKIEDLFSPGTSRKVFTMAPASHLFRCTLCEKILIRGLDHRISCQDSRLCVSATGGIIYRHNLDESWSIHDQMSDWVREYRSHNKSVAESTTMLYWRLWSCLNCAECETCGQIFLLSEIGHCRFHSDSPNFGKDDNKGIIPIVQGMYNCCGVFTLRFDPFRINKGCKVKDHILKLPANCVKHGDEEPHLDKILDVLANLRNLFEVPYVSQYCDRDFISGILGRDNIISRGKVSDCIMKENEENEHKTDSNMECLVRPRLQPLVRRCHKVGIPKKKISANTKIVDDTEEDIEEVEDADREDIIDNNVHSEDSHLEVTIKTGAILLDAPQFPVFNSKKWDNSKSLRYNQDSQRQEDLRRMRQIVNYLIGLRIDIDKSPKSKSREMTGGIYCQLEQQWRADMSDRNAVVAANLISQRSLSNLRIKQKQLGGMQPFK